MTCPHCLKGIHSEDRRLVFDVADARPRVCQRLIDLPPEAFPKELRLSWLHCPACRRLIVHGAIIDMNNEGRETPVVVWPPRRATRDPLDAAVPGALAELYQEAAEVNAISPRASAALSRRCLQQLLRDKGYFQRDLDKQIDALLDKNELPSEVARDVDAIRQVGNFAAHPMKSTNSGEVLDVETGEAEWLLDVLEQLFAFWFVDAARRQARRDELNRKLAAAGKPPLKAPKP
jgi:hypothetical protein